MSKRFSLLGSAGLGTMLTVALAGCGGAARTEPPSPQPEEPPSAAEEPAEAPPTAEAPLSVLVPGIDLDTVRAGRFDNGKMWTFEYPPIEYFREQYDFAPDSAWFARARLGALRLPNCTASFVSPNGLVLTNHHCARESVSQVSQPGEQLLDTGFYATAVAQERQVEDLYVDQLIAIEDVSDRILAAAEGAATDEQGAQRREAEIDRISAETVEQYGGEEAGIVVEVIALWNGARYSAYVFQRYSDVRLVLAPELALGKFGGDPDNFTYPRYSLDMSFLRVYGEDGQPHRPDHYFRWSEEGAGEGDAVFVVGNPGSTSRLQTVAQLEWRRAIGDKAILDFYTSRANALQAFYDRYPDIGEELDLRNEIFSLQNSQKAYSGIWRGLFDPVIMAKRRDAQNQLVEAIRRDPALSERYSGLVERMADIQREKMEFAPEYGAFLGLGNPDLEASVVTRGLWGLQFAAGLRSGAPAEALDGVKQELLAVGSQPQALQEELLAARLADFLHYFGAEDPGVQAILMGGSPEWAAREIVGASILTDSSTAARAVEDGTISLEDPAVQLVRNFLRRFGNFQQAFVELSDQEERVAAQLGRAHFAVYGTSKPPDATFSLRVADGVVKGYEYNGTIAPPHTTFYGLFDHYYSYGGAPDWDLPENWLSPPAEFDLSTALNLALTADIIGGNSGSPVLDRDLRVVGLIFDGNIESLPGEYIYDPTANRAVAVDVRGILEALDVMYDADRIVLELTSGKLVQDEAEADAELAATR